MYVMQIMALLCMNEWLNLVPHTNTLSHWHNVSVGNTKNYHPDGYNVTLKVHVEHDEKLIKPFSDLLNIKPVHDRTEQRTNIKQNRLSFQPPLHPICRLKTFIARFASTPNAIHWSLGVKLGVYQSSTSGPHWN